MNNETEEKFNKEIRLIKKELVEIKEMMKTIQSDISKMTGINRSPSLTTIDSYKNEKHSDCVPTSPRLLKKKSWRLSTPNTGPTLTNDIHVKRRATESNIVYPKNQL